MFYVACRSCDASAFGQLFHLRGPPEERDHDGNAAESLGGTRLSRLHAGHAGIKWRLLGLRWMPVRCHIDGIGPGLREDNCIHKAFGVMLSAPWRARKIVR